MRVPDEARDLERYRDEFFLAIHTGSFDEAYSALDGWERAAATSVDTILRLYPFVVRVDLDLELEREDSARRTARRLADAWQPWVRSEFSDAEIETTRALYITGEMGPDAFLRARSHDEEKLAARGGYFSAASIRWYETYVQSVRTAEDALVAIGRRPKDDIVAEAVFRDVGVDFQIGRMYLMGSDIDKALPALRRAANSCTYWKALQGVQAHALYGDALARSNSA